MRAAVYERVLKADGRIRPRGAVRRRGAKECLIGFCRLGGAWRRRLWVALQPGDVDCGGSAFAQHAHDDAEERLAALAVDEAGTALLQAKGLVGEEIPDQAGEIACASDHGIEDLDELAVSAFGDLLLGERRAKQLLRGLSEQELDCVRRPGQIQEGLDD